ncbi:DNA polymerase III subunit delta' [Clostridium amazonitimonense]|uniref:DNA polymerase III subunit delta' n=1 Tax=Clostridium amazonitimonense TaxID=1499689 RepID=UPI000509898B|nr:DNA polymerase III subunit delta' [Clostridium amazonitimonense]
MQNIIGHEKVIFSFYNAIQNQTLSHAHLLIGEDGIGKSILAHNLALKILNKEEEKQYADIIHYKNTKKSMGVNEIRELIEEINKKPFEGNKKVIIIYEGQKMTTQAQNAFLKTIEEPPKGVYIIILCENSEAILDTIKSRCQIHKMNMLKEDEMRKYIDNTYPELGEDDIKVMLAFSNGIPGRIDKFLKDSNFNDMRNLILSILKDMNCKDMEYVVKYEEEMMKYKDNYEELLTTMLFLIRDIMIYKEVGEEYSIINKDKIKDISCISKEVSFSKLDKLVNIINDTKYSLDRNTNSAMTLDVMLLNILEV